MKLFLEKVKNLSGFRLNSLFGPNQKWLYVFFISVLSLLLFKSLFLVKGVSIFADTSPFVLNMNSFTQYANYTYVEKYMGSSNLPINIATFFIIANLFKAISVFTTNIFILNALWVFLPFLALNVVIFFFFSNFFKDKRIAFLLTLFFIFSYYSFGLVWAGYSTVCWSLSGGILFFIFWTKLLQTRDFKYSILMALSTLLALVNSAYFYSILIICILYFIFLVILIKEKKSFIKQSWLKIFLTSAMCFLLNAYWIIPYIVLCKEYPNVYGGVDDGTLDFVTKTSTTLQNILLRGYIPPAYEELLSVYRSNMYYIVFFISLILILHFYLLRQKKDKNLLILSLMLIVIFAISLGDKSILWKILSFLPGWFLMRVPTRFFYFIFLIILVLAGYAIDKNKKRKITFVLVSLFLTMNIYFFIKSDIFGFYKPVTIPTDYSEVINFLALPSNNSEKLVVFPKFPWYLNYEWIKSYDTPNLFDLAISNPTATYFIDDNRMPENIAKIYDGKISSEELSSYLGSLSVRYIISQHDVRNSENMSFDVEDNKGLTKVVDGKNLTLYQINDNLVKPLISSPTNPTSFFKVNPTKYYAKINLKNNDNKLILNQTYDKNWNVSIVPENLNLFSKNVIRTDGLTQELTPSNKFVETSDLTYPFEKNVQSFQSNHNKTDLQTNSWDIQSSSILNNYPKNYYSKRQDGSLDIVVEIYFSPQTKFYYGLILSGIAFLLSVIYLITRMNFKNGNRIIYANKSKK